MQGGTLQCGGGATYNPGGPLLYMYVPKGPGGKYYNKSTVCMLTVGKKRKIDAQQQTGTIRRLFASPESGTFLIDTLNNHIFAYIITFVLTLHSFIEQSRIEKTTTEFNNKISLQGIILN